MVPTSGVLLVLALAGLAEGSARLPSFQATHALEQNVGSLDQKGLWWVRVKDQVLHAPPSFLGLSQNISNYYYAYGSHTALTDELKQHRVGGEGRVHIFHLPEGPSMLQTPSAAGGRRHSMSVLVELKHGIKLSDEFPSYRASAEYTNPLGKSGQAVEATLVGDIKPEQIMLYLGNLTSLPGPNAPSRSWSSAEASQASSRFLQAHFESLGFQTCLHNFRRGGADLNNVVAYLPGKSGAVDSVTLGAHYDSRPYDGPAPGAVDNGSGVAALMATAAAFAKARVSPAKPVYFVAFAAEEPGLWGSETFAGALAGEAGAALPEACRIPSSFLQTRRPQHRALIMDEVAWRSPNLATDTVNLESYDSSAEVLDQLAAASQTHNGGGLAVVHSSNPFGSDHMSFLKRGMKAALTIHGDDEGYPDYHKSSDSIKNVNPELLARITKMNAAALLRLAGV